MTQSDDELNALKAAVDAAQKAMAATRKASASEQKAVDHALNSAARALYAGADTDIVGALLAPIRSPLLPAQTEASQPPSGVPASREQRLAAAVEILRTEPDVNGVAIARRLGGMSERTGQRLLRDAREQV